eukprot:scaffold42103_cov61-Phaeocystis_antarctica.AAC.4
MHGARRDPRLCGDLLRETTQTRVVRGLQAQPVGSRPHVSLSISIYLSILAGWGATRMGCCRAANEERGAAEPLGPCGPKRQTAASR